MSTIKVIIVVVILCCYNLVESECHGRKYKDGGKPEDKTTIDKYHGVCKDLKREHCIKADETCLWIPDKEQAVFLEGPSIASVHHFDVSVIKTAKEFEKAWKARTDFDEELIKDLKSETDADLKENLRILTCGRDDTWYEMKPTSLDAHDKEMKRVYDLYQTLVTAKKAKRHKKRRRLIVTAPVPGRDRLVPPYTSFGLLKVGESRFEMGNAVGTIIHINDEQDFLGYGFVYVLAAGHDVLKASMEPEETRRIIQYAPLREYKFYPHFVGDVAARRARNGDDHFGLTILWRTYILSTYDPRTGAGSFEADIAVFKFHVRDIANFPFPAVQVVADATIPNVPPAVATHNMIVYNKYDRDAPDGILYSQYQADVPIFCVNNLCEYNQVKILRGYCGGPIISPGTTNIAAMQVGRRRMAAGGAGCDTGDANCIGIGTKISLVRQIAIRVITVYDRTPVAWGLSTDYPAAAKITENNVYSSRVHHYQHSFLDDNYYVDNVDNLDYYDDDDYYEQSMDDDFAAQQQYNDLMAQYSYDVAIEAAKKKRAIARLQNERQKVLRFKNKINRK